MNDREATTLELRDATHSLIRLWHTRREVEPDRTGPGHAEARLHMVNGLSSHAYRLAESADHLIGLDLSLESAPLVRLALECSVTAMWAALVPDGVEAILNEDFRSRRNMSTSMAEVASWTDLLSDASSSTDRAFETVSGGQARHFNQLCDDLTPGGSELYTYYRLLSWFSHPTNYVIDRYGELPEGHDVTRLRLRRAAKLDPDDPQLYAFLNAVAATIAACALDEVDVAHSHRDQIASLADQIGCASEFHLTQSALSRLAGHR